MASPEWMEIYRGYSPAELSAEIADLKRQKSLFSQQSVGNKSATRDLQELKNQLHAATRVQNERANQRPPGQSLPGVMDFSRGVV